MEARILLTGDSAFAKLKEVCIWLWKHREEPHEVLINAYKETRSTRANAWYWTVVVTPAADQLGYTPEELHEVLCCAIYGTRKVQFGSLEVDRPNRTTTWPKKMKVDEFNLHIERACALLSDQGVSIDQSGWRE